MITYKSISILKRCSIQEDIGGSETIPYKAIHSKILSPFTKVFNSPPFVKYSARTGFTPREKVLGIHRTIWKLRGAAPIEIYDFEGSGGR